MLRRRAAAWQRQRTHVSTSRNAAAVLRKCAANHSEAKANARYVARWWRPAERGKQASKITSLRQRHKAGSGGRQRRKGGTRNAASVRAAAPVVSAYRHATQHGANSTLHVHGAAHGMRVLPLSPHGAKQRQRRSALNGKMRHENSSARHHEAALRVEPPRYAQYEPACWRRRAGW